MAKSYSIKIKELSEYIVGASKKTYDEIMSVDDKWPKLVRLSDDRGFNDFIILDEGDIVDGCLYMNQKSKDTFYPDSDDIQIG